MKKNILQTIKCLTNQDPSKSHKIDTKWNKKILHTGDTESLDRRGWKHQYQKKSPMAKKKFERN